MDFGFKNKRIVITGASRGIGAEIARFFSREGGDLTLIARDKTNLKNLISSFKNNNNHDFIDINLRDDGAPTEVVNKVLLNHNKIDVLVHNVGGGLGVKDPTAKIKDWLKVWQFNVGIAIEMNNIVVPKMQESKWGRIVHISSINAVNGGTMVKPYGGAPAYSCAKAYLNMYTTVLSREVGKDNVIVSSIMPGTILSKGKHWDKLRKKDPKLYKDYINQYHSIGRMGSASEIAPFVLLLSSDYASFASGSIFPIDGGML